MPRDTAPCSFDTPLARWARRRPMCAMLNMFGLSSAPSASTRSVGTPGSRSVVEVVADHVDREAVDARGHRRVRGEHGARPHGRQRLVEREARAGAQLPDALQPEVARVPLVGVEHLGLRVPGDRAVRADGAHAADADQDLLPDALVLVAAVEPVGDAAQVGVVLLDVGVEHQQRHPADRGLPDARLQQLPGGHRDLDEHLLARSCVDRAAAAAAPAGRAPGRSPAASRRATATAGSTPTGTAAPPR